MTRTVDVVIVGAHPAAAAAAIAAARRGLRVLVVTRSRRARFGHHLRRSLRAAGDPLQRQVTVLSGAEVVCADGIDALEAVVIRRITTGRLISFNASAIWSKRALSAFGNVLPEMSPPNTIASGPRRNA